MRRPCTGGAGGGGCGGAAGGEAEAEPEPVRVRRRSLGAPAVHSNGVVHGRLGGGGCRGLGPHCEPRLLQRRTLVGPRCLLRPPTAALVLLLSVGSDLAFWCAAYISVRSKKPKFIIIIPSLLWTLDFGSQPTPLLLVWLFV